MPALRLFGRKWLAATDDLVYPGVFEIFIRVIWFILLTIACIKYYDETWRCRTGGELVRVFLTGELILLGVVTMLLFAIVTHSSKGSIADTHSRRLVEPLLTIKILLIFPEVTWNVLGTFWMFTKQVECSEDNYTIPVVEGLVLFDWVLVGLTMLGLALVFDPLGSMGLRDEDIQASEEHRKVSSTWMRRFKFFWWMQRDESAHETFQHVAGLLSALFRGTDLVPSDVMAGCVLLRVRQKRETLELERLNVLNRPAKTPDAGEIFDGAPSWMSLEWAQHYMQLSIASYAWLFVMYQHTCTGCFRLIKDMTCCACFRRKENVVIDDNCCFCNLAGVKYLSGLSEDDILYASFRNHLCEIPFCVVADHKTSSIVIVVRGSLSLRDLITDIAAASDHFEADCLPPGSMAHRGMIIGAKVLLKQLNQSEILTKAFTLYPHYNLTLTGHSLGAGLAVLLGLLIRPLYPNLRVYAFSTPAGLLSREAARVTEEFVFTVGLGDDLVMRLSVDSIENFRTSLLITLDACRLPKYRVVLNGLGYALFGVPDRDLERMWRNGNTIGSAPGQLPLLADPPMRHIRDAMSTAITSDVLFTIMNAMTGNYFPVSFQLCFTECISDHEETTVLERDVALRRYSSVRLYTAGRILHISRRKPSPKEEDSNEKNSENCWYEMRWAQAEDFMELSVMPRMLLDHLPENLERALTGLLNQQDRVPGRIDVV